MKQTVQNKIDNLKAFAKGSVVSKHAAVKASRTVNDSLSESIRNERDAKVFRKELKVAFKLAKS